MATMASESFAGQQTTQSGTPEKTRRPFVWLTPVDGAEELSADVAKGLSELDHRIGDDVQMVVRALVNFTVATSIARQRQVGRAVGVPLSVLNRRRRSARAWIVAILMGQVDSSTLHALTHTWIPQLVGTGPDVARAAVPGARLIEFVRGVITALVMAEPADNLVPQAKALHAMESVLGVHLQALRDVSA